MLREHAFLAVGLVTGTVWFSLAISAYATGLGLAVVCIGVPLLVGIHRAMRAVAGFERWHVRTLLGLDLGVIPPLDAPARGPHDRRWIVQFAVWARAVLEDAYSWRALAWVAVRGVTGPIGFALVITVWITAATLVLLPLALVVPGFEVPVGQEHWALLVLVGPLLAVLVCTPLAWLAHGWAALHRPLARWALGPSEAEFTKAATERAELAEQQVRIDQELHDSIGHMITMNIVQAGAGAHVFDTDPAFAREALRNIEERGRVAMAELDRIIATMRGDDAVPRAPLPELADVAGLALASRAAGVDVELVLTDAAVPSPLGRAAYAIVREGVTNAAKHAPGSSVHVHIDVDSDALGIAVVNTAPPENPRQDGSALTDGLGNRLGVRHGLAGIRDRVALLGGRSVTGPTADGGFEVLALFPLEVTLGAINAQDMCECHLWSRLRDRLSV